MRGYRSLSCVCYVGYSRVIPRRQLLVYWLRAPLKEYAAVYVESVWASLEGIFCGAFVCFFWEHILWRGIERAVSTHSLGEETTGCLVSTLSERKDSGTNIGIDCDGIDHFHRIEEIERKRKSIISPHRCRGYETLWTI